MNNQIIINNVVNYLVSTDIFNLSMTCCSLNEELQQYVDVYNHFIIKESIFNTKSVKPYLTIMAVKWFVNRYTINFDRIYDVYILEWLYNYHKYNNLPYLNVLDWCLKVSK